MKREQRQSSRITTSTCLLLLVASEAMAFRDGDFIDHNFELKWRHPLGVSEENPPFPKERNEVGKGWWWLQRRLDDDAMDDDDASALHSIGTKKLSRRSSGNSLSGNWIAYNWSSMMKGLRNVAKFGACYRYGFPLLTLLLLASSSFRPRFFSLFLNYRFCHCFVVLYK